MKPLHALLLAVLGRAGRLFQARARPAPVRAVRIADGGAAVGRWVQEYAGEVRARTESRLGFRVGGKIPAVATPTWATTSRPASCWPSSTRRICGSGRRPPRRRCPPRR